MKGNRKGEEEEKKLRDTNLKAKEKEKKLPKTNLKAKSRKSAPEMEKKRKRRSRRLIARQSKGRRKGKEAPGH